MKIKMKMLVMLIFNFVIITNAVLPDYPKREILFKYTADFRTGIINSDIPGSQFILNADLYVQLHADSRLDVLYLKNSKISLYNGELPMEGEHDNENFLTILKSAEDLENPFIIGGTEEEGKIFTNINEPIWIVNLKKSIASLFEFDWKTFEKNSKNISPQKFTKVENTLYGKCLVSYTMAPTQEENWMVNKKQNPKRCTHFTQWTSSMEENICDNGFDDDDNYVTENNKIYKVADWSKDEYFTRVFMKIEANGKILVFPFSQNGNLMYTNVKQTIEFVKHKSVNEIKFEKMVPHNMDFSYEEYDETDLLDVITGGFENPELDNQTNLYICVNGIEALSKNYRNPDMYNYVIKKFSYFTAEEFQNCYENFENSDFLEIFVKIIPMIGTKASVIFIKHIIQANTLDASISSTMLQFFPFKVLVPTEELLETLKELIDPDFEMHSSVKSAVILSYGTLIYRTFKLNSESAVLEEYINIYYAHLKAAKTFPDQLMWLQGLTNIQIGSVWKLLIPIIKGEQILDIEYDQYFQVQAIWGAYNLIKEHKTEFLEVLWPIIIDQTLDAEFRVIAIKVYIHGSNNRKDFSELFWYMQTETDWRVYNYFKSEVKVIGESNSYCKSSISQYAKQLKKYMKTFDSHSETYSFANENYNNELGMGGKIHGIQITANYQYYSILNYFEIDAYAMRKSFNLFSIYYSNMLFNATYHQDEKIEIKIDLIIRFNHKIVYTQISKKTHRSSYPPVFSLLQNDNFLYIFDLLNLNKIVPTDIGLPLYFNNKMPLLTQLQTIHNNGKISCKLQQSLIGNNGITIYNPFSNVIHGIINEIQFNFNLPLNFELEEGFRIKIQLNNYTDDNIIRFENSINTIVFLSPASNSENLLDSCTNCTLNLSIIESLKNEDVETKGAWSEIGLDYIIKQESRCPEETDLKKMNWFNKGLNTLKRTFLTERYFTFFGDLSLRYYELFKCNRHIKIESSELNPVDELSAMLKLDESNLWINITSPDALKTIRWEAVLDKIRKNKDDWSATFSRSVEGQPILNICYKYITKYINDANYEGKFLYYHGYSNEKECVTDDFELKINFDGKQSEEQIKSISDNSYTYKSCESNTKYISIPSTVSRTCITDHTSLRSYTFDIEYKNVPEFYRSIFKYVWYLIKANNEYETKHDSTTFPNSNQISVDLTYPMYTDSSNLVVDILVRLFGEIYIFESVPEIFDYNDMKNYYLYLNYYADCVTKINDDIVVDGFAEYVKLPETHKWLTMIVNQINPEHTFQVDVKSMKEENLSIRISIDNYTLVVRPNENNSTFTYDMDDFYFENMTYNNGMNEFGVKIFKIKDSFLLFSRYFYSYVIFNGKYVKATTLPMNRERTCLDKKIHV